MKHQYVASAAGKTGTSLSDAECQAVSSPGLRVCIFLSYVLVIYPRGYIMIGTFCLSSSYALCDVLLSIVEM